MGDVCGVEKDSVCTSRRPRRCSIGLSIYEETNASFGKDAVYE